MNNYTKTDVVVIGAGMVGAAAALGLAEAGFSVVVVESNRPKPFDSLRQPDLRISAINASSINLLTNLGIWQDARHMRSAPYLGLEAWELEGSRFTFHAKDLGIPELGYMIENEVLKLSLWLRLEQIPNIRIYSPADFKILTKANKRWIVGLSNGVEVEAKLVIGSDGGRSQIRDSAGIGLIGWQYRQSCMMILIQMDDDPLDIAWQKFTPHGPRSFLPLWEHWASLVWYDNPARIRQLMELSMSQLTKEIKNVFPPCLGCIRAIHAGSFQLLRLHANCYVQEGLALLGDAAHTMHPLTGQGVNLGYLDVDALLNVVIAARNKGEHWYSENILKRYQHIRRSDNLLMQAGIDLLYSAFNNDLILLKIVRNLGLIAAESSIELKKGMLKYLLGL
ncbi:FAD-dependent oxidoreductase [Candidatus Profftia tarda]|uniref:2-octaprenyl-3-methyl-6-methoxy-1,4-benzoquinol hydroxylase n=1 Tax=Candidatus Profftia tarda TaxID=1177216 RepID=A0A8E4GI51_9ENTR|nr:FAD-dependent oxidoreductase [Candidatus Profftia tarda]CAD6509735.1 2-octaprenyl-3-methyl-6-methoxy-1,4-benzoquinol hydroxylase [Candidatus Profftia tarda]